MNPPDSKTKRGIPIRVLVAEDVPAHAELNLRELRRAGFDPQWVRVDTEPAFLEKLSPDLDLILCDFAMPQFTGLRALELIRERGIEVPFIIISGTIGEETAVEAMRRGASDYLLKDRLARLGPAAEHALAQRKIKREREAAARALEETEERLNTIVENLNEGLIISDLEGRMLHWNPAALRMHGFALDAEWPRTRGDLASVFEFATAEGVPVAFEDWPLARICRGERLTDCELHVRRVGEEWARIFSYGGGTARDVDGHAVAFLTITDVSQRKRDEVALRESEARFRQVVENIHEVFWMSDPAKNQFLYVSAAFASIWGRPCESLYRDASGWFEAIHPEDRARVAEAARTKQALGTYDETYRVQRPDGALRWIRDRAFPVRDASGRVYRVVGTAEDITEYRQLEEQFRQAQKMEAIGTLAGGIAHDFNNILAAINGYTGLARMSCERGGEVDNFLAEVEQASARATDLVRQILAFSRQRERERNPLQLRHVVAETVKLLRASIPSTIEFKTSLASDLPAVMSDATQIHQIVMNLCTNAAHAMRNQHGRLDVRLERCDVTPEMAATCRELREGSYVRLAVVDTGHGMDAATKERIFEPFFTTKPLGEGTGLGLAVVHGIMREHEGAIMVESEVGVGTRIELYFPASEAAAAEVEGQADEIPLGHGERILVVDDEEPLARLAQTMLLRLGYQAEAHSTATDALRALRAEPGNFALLLTDQSMPRMTGLDLARAARELRPELPVMILSGHNAALTSERLAAAGVREVLTKPVELRHLAAAVQRALAK